MPASRWCSRSSQGSAAGSAAIASAPARGFRRYASWPGKPAQPVQRDRGLRPPGRPGDAGIAARLGFFVAEAPAATTDLDSEWHEGAENAWGQFSGSSTKLKLGCGWIPDSWREVEELSYAIRQVARSELAGLFDYSTPLGLPALRQHIQKRLRLIDIHVDPEQILTTTGASHALDLLVRTLLKPGDVVVVENPGYYNLFNLLKFHGVKMLGVPRTRHGRTPPRWRRSSARTSRSSFSPTACTTTPPAPASALSGPPRAATGRAA